MMQTEPMVRGNHGHKSWTHPGNWGQSRDRTWSHTAGVEEGIGITGDIGKGTEEMATARDRESTLCLPRTRSLFYRGEGVG